MADSRFLFQPWQRKTYFKKRSNNSVYYWWLSYRNPHGPHPPCCFRHGGRLAIASLKPNQKRLGRVFRTTDSTHSFRAVSSSLIWGTRIRVVCGSHTLEPVQHETGFLVAVISNFLFPAGGEASNVKEHARLFSHARQGNASSLSLGKM